MKILSGTSNLKLSKNIAKNLKLKLINTNIRRFDDGEIYIEINDSEHGINDYWELPIRSCIARIPGKPTPALIATTQSELNAPQKPSTNGVFSGGHKQALENLQKYAIQ